MDLQVGEVSHDYPDSDDEIHRPVVPKVDRIPLIPTDFDSISEAMQNFIAVFESRYVEFSAWSISIVIRE